MKYLEYLFRMLMFYVFGANITISIYSLFYLVREQNELYLCSLLFSIIWKWYGFVIALLSAFSFGLSYLYHNKEFLKRQVSGIFKAYQMTKKAKEIEDNLKKQNPEFMGKNSNEIESILYYGNIFESIYKKLSYINLLPYFKYIYKVINDLDNLTKFSKIMTKLDEVLDFYVSKINTYLTKKYITKDSSYKYFKDMTKKVNEENKEQILEIKEDDEDFDSFIKSQNQNPFNIPPPKNPQEMMEQMQQFMEMMDEMKKFN